jgi:acid phosphatase family membrane protein YuiD
VVVHDAVRFKGSAQEQRVVLYDLVRRLPGEDRLHGAARSLLRVWAHRPFHVAAGVMFGLLFALFCGAPG